MRFARTAITLSAPWPDTGVLSMMMLFRTIAVLTGVILFLAVPALAGASHDPLLSGYGGPGGGEQAILGSKLLPGGKGGSGGGSAPTSLRVVAPTAQTTTAPSDSSAGTSNPQHAHAKQPRDASSGTSASGEATSPAAATPSRSAAPKVIAYPSRVSSAGGLPLSRADVLALLLGAAALVVVVFALRKLASTGESST